MRNRFSVPQVGFSEKRYADMYKRIEFDEFKETLPDVVAEVIDGGDVVFFDKHRRVSSNLASKVFERLKQKHDVDEFSFSDRSSEKYDILKLHIADVLEDEGFRRRMEKEDIYVDPDLDGMIADILSKKGSQEIFDAYYMDVAATRLASDVAVELDKIWDERYGPRPAGAELKERVRSIISGREEIVAER
jgi:hypothetical protein